MVRSRGGSREGGTSGRANRSVIQRYDHTRFSNRENAEWFSKRKNSRIVVEKTVAPSIDGHFHILDAFQTLGWGPILQLSGDYYPELVIEFYANIENKEEKYESTINSMVKGVEIQVTNDVIVELLGVRDDGHRFGMVRDMVPYDSTWRVAEAMRDCGLDWANTRSDS